MKTRVRNRASNPQYTQHYLNNYKRNEKYLLLKSTVYIKSKYNNLLIYYI